MVLALPSECIQNPTTSYHLHATTPVQAPVFCHLDYCSMLLIGLPAAALVCLWSIFNTADWMMLLKYKSAQVKNLWGLLIPRGVKPKVLTVAHKISFSCSPSRARWSRHTRLLAFLWTWQGVLASGPWQYLFLFLPDSHMTYLFLLCSNVPFLVELMLISSFKMQPFPQPSRSVFLSLIKLITG